MKTNNSFFSPSRLVFNGPIAGPDALEAAVKAAKPDFADKGAREKLYNDVQAQVNGMDAKDPNRKPLVDFLGLAKEYHEKNTAAAKYWSEKLYTKLVAVAPQPAAGPRGDVKVGDLKYVEAGGKSTSRVDQRQAEAPTPAAPSAATQPAAAPAAAATAAKTEAKTTSTRRAISQERGVISGTPERVTGGINNVNIGDREVEEIIAQGGGIKLAPGEAVPQAAEGKTAQVVDKSWKIFDDPAQLFKAIGAGGTEHQKYLIGMIRAAKGGLSGKEDFVRIPVQPAGLPQRIVVARRMPPKPGGKVPTLRFYLPSEAA